MRNLQFAFARGAALGINLPDTAERLWEKSYGNVNKEEWDKWRESGLNLPRMPPTALKIRPHAENLLPVVVEFVHRFRPHLENELRAAIDGL